MDKYRIITEEGKELFKTKTYEGAERLYDMYDGIYEDEDGEHRIYIDEI